MPDKDGKLSKEEVAQVIDWLEKKNPSPICPHCQHEDFVVNSHIMHLSSEDGGVVFPAVLIHCTNCTFTSLFSAMAMEILSKKDEGDSA